MEKIRISQLLSPEVLCSVMVIQKELYSESAFLKYCNPEIIHRTHVIKKLRHTRRREAHPVEVTKGTETSVTTGCPLLKYRDLNVL